MPPVFHIVMYAFKEGVGEAKIKECNERMLALKSLGRHPKTGKPYMLHMRGGKDISLPDKGVQHGMTHGFIMSFESIADRDYYVLEDKAHENFRNTIGDIFSDILSLDFDDRNFGETKAKL